jgi:hypothetical protein
MVHILSRVTPEGTTESMSPIRAAVPNMAHSGGPRVNLNEVVGPEWIDDAGRLARERLRAGQSGAVIGHCDWLAENLKWDGDALLVVHDWDSVTVDSEAVLVGSAAALYSTQIPDELATIQDT